MDLDYILEPIIGPLSELLKMVIVWTVGILLLILLARVLGAVNGCWRAVDTWLWKRRLERQQRALEQER